MAPLRFQKIYISDERYESAGVFDVDNDGVLDIVAPGKEGLFLLKNLGVMENMGD